MDRIIRVFRSHAEARASERAELAALSAQERLDILLDLVERYRDGLGEAAQRFERVCRVASLSGR